MAHRTNISVNGETVPVWEFDHTAQEIDDAVDRSYAAVRPNLLPNACFLGDGSPGQFPVDQDGDGVPDLWTVSGSGGNGTTTLSYSSDGLVLSNNRTDATPLICLRQDLPPIRKDLPVTVSVLVKEVSGTWYFSGIIGGPNAQIPAPGLHSFTVEPSGSNKYNQLYFWKGSKNTSDSITIQAVKIEYGRTQTLACQDQSGVWQLLETPDYADALARCQRKGIVYTNLQAAAFSNVDGKALAAQLYLPVTPGGSAATVSDYSINWIRAQGAVVPTPSMNVTAVCSGNQVVMSFTRTDGGAFAPMEFHMVLFNRLELDFSD